MGIVKRLRAIIASGFSLAAAPETQAWKTPQPLGPGRPVPGIPPPPLPADQVEATPVQPLRVVPAPRALIIFASGFALAAVATAGLWMLAKTDSSARPGNPKTSVAAPPSTVASAQPAPCPTEPAAAAASENDGRLPLQASVEGLIVADITSFIYIGNQAAAAGQPRDAEAAFLMSCRVADKLKGAASVESADARYQLGAHYAALALNGGAGAAPQRAELLARAERLYADSAQAYLASFGQGHEKSQLAAQGLAAVRQAIAPTPMPTPAPALAQAQTTPLEPQPQLAARSEASETLPGLAPSVAGPAPAASLLPRADALGKARQRPPVLKECLPAVATLGLCDPQP